MTNRSPNPNLKNYQNEKINLNVNRFMYLYANQPKGNPKSELFFNENKFGKRLFPWLSLKMRLLDVINKFIQLI